MKVFRLAKQLACVFFKFEFFLDGLVVWKKIIFTAIFTFKKRAGGKM